MSEVTLEERGRALENQFYEKENAQKLAAMKDKLAVQDLIEASATRNLDATADAQIALTTSCVRCHLHMTRRRLAK